MKRKQANKRRLCNIPFHITPDIKFQIACYAHIMEAKKPLGLVVVIGVVL